MVKDISAMSVGSVVIPIQEWPLNPHQSNQASKGSLFQVAWLRICAESSIWSSGGLDKNKLRPLVIYLDQDPTEIEAKPPNALLDLIKGPSLNDLG